MYQTNNKNNNNVNQAQLEYHKQFQSAIAQDQKASEYYFAELKANNQSIKRWLEFRLASKRQQYGPSSLQDV